MSTTFDRGLRVAAVLASGAMLLFSTYAKNGLESFRSESTSATDKRDVLAGLLILDRAATPIRALQPCDAIKALLPEKFDTAAGNRTINEPSGDAIVCFKKDIDYDAAVGAAALRGFFWQTGIGGKKIVAFAPNEAAFRRAAAKDNLVFARGELTPINMLSDRMQTQGGAKQDERGWVLAPSQAPSEVLFGPYIDLAPGPYRLTLTLEPLGQDSCSLIAQKGHLEIAVAGDARRQMIASRQTLPLQPVLVGAKCQLQTSIFFVVAAATKGVETPLWFSGHAFLRLTAIDLYRKPVLGSVH